jgi:cytochrome c553
MVAFLRRLPGMDSAQYRSLAYGDADHAGDGAPETVRNICARCHGLDGTGRGGAFPSLAGQQSMYLYGALRAFADGARFSGIMRTVAATLDDQTMREMAAYYESLPPRPADGRVDGSARARGEMIAMRGVPDRDIPSCADCHGPASAPRNPAYPVLAGQEARYLRLQLELLRQRQRGGSGYVNLMHAFVNRLDEPQMTDVTTYYASLDVRP